MYFFLLQGAPSDIVQLNRALMSRIAVSKRTNTSAQNSTSQKAAERLEAAADDEEFVDKPSDELCSQDDPKPEPDANTADKQNTSTENERLEQTTQETDESHADNDTDEDKTKVLKRKEPAEEETQSKRQCPDILIE